MKWWFPKASRNVKARQERRLLEQALRAAPNPVPPDGLKERLLAQLPADLVEGPAPRHSRVGRFRWAWGVAVGLALAAVWLWHVAETPALAQLAQTARAMAQVQSAHFVGTDERGGKVEGWFEAPDRFRLDGPAGRVLMDDGNRLVIYDPASDRTEVRPSGSALGEEFPYQDWFTAEGLIERTQVAKCHGGSVTERDEIGEQGRVRVFELDLASRWKTVLYTDPETHLILSIRHYRGTGSQYVTAGGLDKIEYDVPVAESTFRYEPPEPTKVVDTRVPAEKVKWREEQMRELDAESNVTGADVFHLFKGGPGSSCDSFHPGYRFRNVGEGLMGVYYRPTNNTYEVIGKALVLPDREVVEDRVFRPKGAPVLTETLLDRGQSGAFCGLRYETPYRLQNVGEGPLTVLYRKPERDYLVQGKAKLIPTGEVFENEAVLPEAGGWWNQYSLERPVAQNVAPGETCTSRYHPDVRFENLGKGPLNVYFQIARNAYRVEGRARMFPSGEAVSGEVVEPEKLFRSGRFTAPEVIAMEDEPRLDWGNLPEAERATVQADLAYYRRMAEVTETTGSNADVIIDGQEARGSCGLDVGTSCGRDPQFHNIGPGLMAVYQLADGRYYVIGRAKISPTDEVVENGFTDADGDPVEDE